MAPWAAGYDAVPECLVLLSFYFLLCLQVWGCLGLRLLGVLVIFTAPRLVASRLGFLGQGVCVCSGMEGPRVRLNPKL